MFCYSAFFCLLNCVKKLTHVDFHCLLLAYERVSDFITIFSIQLHSNLRGLPLCGLAFHYSFLAVD